MTTQPNLTAMTTEQNEAVKAYRVGDKGVTSYGMPYRVIKNCQTGRLELLTENDWIISIEEYEAFERHNQAAIEPSEYCLICSHQH